MSLATNIKEFADVLHNIYAQHLSSLGDADIRSEGVLSLTIPKIVVFQEACTYLVKSLGYQIFSVLSFQWLKDFSYFPLISHEIGNSETIVTDTFLSEPASYLFSFSKNGVSLKPAAEHKQDIFFLFNGFFRGDYLLAGVVNSFFFSLPFSLPHFITLRRMFSQGAAAAVASIFGTVAAHSLLLLGVIYGIRFLVIPYYSLQPLTFFLGLIIMAMVITEFVKEKRIYLVPLKDSSSLIRIGVINFIVALCESGTLFHDLHHLTLNQDVTYLQLYQPSNTLNGFFVHTTYLLTFVLGHALFSFLFCYGILKGNEKLCSFTGWTLPRTASQINKGLLIAILTLTFASFPYYGLDYLFTKSAGFLPEDPAYSNTLFSPTQLRSRNRHFKSRAPATKDSKTVLELDVNYFDRGMYLNAPKEEKISAPISASTIEVEQPFSHENFGEGTNTGSLSPNPSSDSLISYDPALSFEELNYQGESAWLMRHERARRLPDSQDSKKPSIFQKPKSHFKELRVEQDNKLAEAALKERAQMGVISEWREGMIPGEKLLGFSHKIARVNEGNEDSTGQTNLATRDIAEGDTKIQRDRSIRKTELTTSGKNSLQNEAQQRALVKELFFDREVSSAYEKSFASPFGEDSDGTPPDLLPVENIIKKRYRLNPVYRALLQSDIDSFIARQPSEYKITQNQEANLFKKRQLLEKYYNSIRYYSPVESTLYATPIGDHESDTFKDVLTPSLIKGNSLLTREMFFKNPKSFIEMVYHQQFKGTLTTVKKFFKLTFDEQVNPSKNRILSYDQPLYKNSQDSLKNGRNDKNNHPSLHEELSLEKVSPFMEESNSAPIYAGWDEKTRQFVITNKFSFIERNF